MKSEDKRKGKLEYIEVVEAISGNRGIAMVVILVMLCLFSVLSVSALQVSENVEFKTPGTSTTFVMGYSFTFDKIEVHSTYLMLDNAAISVQPSVGAMTFTLFDFSTDYKKWSEECSNPGATTTHTLGGLKTKTPYLVIVDGATYGSYTSNGSGYVSFTYSGGYSDVVFEMKEDIPVTPTPSPSPSATLTSSPTLTPEPTPTSTFPKPEIEITQTTCIEEPKVGEEIIITVTITNIGKAKAANIYLRETIPSSVAVSSVIGATSSSPNSVLWEGELGAGQMHSIEHRLKILEEKNRFFQAKADFKDEHGNEYQASATIYIMPKTASPPTPKTAGFEVIFAIAGLLLTVAYLLKRRK